MSQKATCSAQSHLHGQDMYLIKIHVCVNVDIISSYFIAPVFMHPYYRVRLHNISQLIIPVTTVISAINPS